MAPRPQPVHESSPEPFVRGDRVRVLRLTDYPELNGTTATICGRIDEKRWLARLDGKGKWMVLGSHLERLPRPVIKPGEDQVKITGTWMDWQACDMVWNQERQSFLFDVELGSKGEESFQILINGKWDERLYPDIKDGSPYKSHNICGPDSSGSGRNWTLGKHARDKGCAGATYTVQLLLTPEGFANLVSWKRIGVPLGSSGAVSIAGTWDNWKEVQNLTLDSDKSSYSFVVNIGKDGFESFQFLVDGSWEKCIYPDKADACPRVAHTLCGPDKAGHGKNWTIGKHPEDVAEAGACFRIRLHVSDFGAIAVDWARVEEQGATAPRVQLGSYASICIAGTWDKWRVTEMERDSEKSQYTFDVVLGESAEESFQILLDRDWSRCIYPDKADACPHAPHTLRGPDSEGHGKNWTIGKHACESPSAGDRYVVRLHLSDDGCAALVDYVRGEDPEQEDSLAEPATGGPTPERPATSCSDLDCDSAFIVGSWSSWKFEPMNWDDAGACYVHEVRLGDSGQESFQIVLDGDWKRCLHPDVDHANSRSPLCGPDDQGHGKNWTIRRPPDREGAGEDLYRVKLRISCDAALDWSPI